MGQDLLLVIRVSVARETNIAQPEFERIKSRFTRHILHQTFGDKNNLRCSVGAHRPCTRHVGINSFGVIADHAARIHGAGLGTTGKSDGMAVRGVCSSDRNNVEIKKLELSLAGNSPFGFAVERVPSPCRGDGLFAGQIDLNRSPIHFPGQEGNHRLNNNILLRPKTTADIRFYNFDIANRKIDRFAGDSTNDMGNLSR